MCDKWILHLTQCNVVNGKCLFFSMELPCLVPSSKLYLWMAGMKEIVHFYVILLLFGAHGMNVCACIAFSCDSIYYMHFKSLAAKAYNIFSISAIYPTDSTTQQQGLKNNIIKRVKQRESLEQTIVAGFIF